MIYTDRSRYETGQRCARERFWGYHFPHGAGPVPGLAPRNESLDLAFGSVVHEFIENWAMKRSQDAAWTRWKALQSDVQTPDGFSVKDEYESLYKGLTKTFAEWTYPRILGEFDWIDSEVEITLDLGNEIKWMSRLDGVLQRRSDGLWFVLETKTSSMPEDLVREAQHNFQLLMEVEAMRKRFELRPEQCGGAMLLVLNKGRKSRATESERARGRDGHRRLSPFTYWYAQDKANGTSEFSLEYRKGFERRPVWTIPDWWGVGSVWREQFESQVQLWPSVGFDAEHCKAVIRQVVATESRLVFDDPELVDRFFPQNFKQCSNNGGFRRPCAFYDCCFVRAVGSDPLGAGFEPRVANHPQEGEEK